MMHCANPFPVLAPFLSPGALIQEVLPGFAVGEIGQCSFYSSGFNHTYRVRTADGRAYWLRAYRFTSRPLHYIGPFLAHRPDDWAYVRQFAESLRQKLLRLPAGQLEQGFCHGYLQGCHARVAEDSTLTFFDFDCGGYGYRAYDLAVFLWCPRLQGAMVDLSHPSGIKTTIYIILT
jgi:Ser/Thr protein kinase RdoA (MazF antagonist)